MRILSADKELLTVKDLASYWTCSESYIYKQVESGDLPFVRMPGSNRIRFPKKEIDDLMRRNFVKSVA